MNVCTGDIQYNNDADSVAAWIIRDRDKGEESIVRYSKFQGDTAEERLNENDFMLVIMSPAQVAGLRLFGRRGKEVALDSTHGTNAYDFQLTTLLVIDEHGEGFPAAFCYSNRVDETAITIFLEKCREALGQV